MSPTPASLQAAGEGNWTLQGAVTFDSVPHLWAQGLQVTRAGAPAQVDLSGVQAVDSAGLALLLAWRGQAQARGVPLRYAHAPARLLALADLTDSTALLLADPG